MIVSLRQGDTGVYEPYVIYKFPEIVSIGHVHVQQIIAVVRLSFLVHAWHGRHIIGYMYWGIVGDGVLTTRFVATQYHFRWSVLGQNIDFFR